VLVRHRRGIVLGKGGAQLAALRFACVPIGAAIMAPRVQTRGVASLTTFDRAEPNHVRGDGMCCDDSFLPQLDVDDAL
jgi:hypothetical protein